MELTLDNPQHANLIAAYEPGRLQVGTQHYTTNILLRTNAIETWNLSAFSALQADDLHAIIQTCQEAPPQLIVIGCGQQQQHLSAELLAPCYQRGIGVEVMTTLAACRTYNLLCSDGREVVAALIV